jgi:hypothetical protein
MTTEQIAKVAHELNRALCNALQDPTQVSWEEAPEWQRVSAVNGVKLHIEHPETTPEQSHENWMKEKIADGWEYGLIKDADRKRHPCIVPYNSLPFTQKIKDYVFKAVCEQLIPFIQ